MLFPMQTQFKKIILFCVRLLGKQLVKHPISVLIIKIPVLLTKYRWITCWTACRACNRRYSDARSPQIHQTMCRGLNHTPAGTFADGNIILYVQTLWEGGCGGCNGKNYGMTKWLPTTLQVNTIPWQIQVLHWSLLSTCPLWQATEQTRSVQILARKRREREREKSERVKGNMSVMQIV